MNRTEFVAEVSSNHGQSLKRCLQFVQTAAAVGCDSVKFQLFRIDELFAPQILKRSAKHKKRKKWEMPVSYLSRIKAECDSVNVGFGCTPFYLDAVEELFPYVDYYKVASYELLWDDLLKECARTGKPVIISTGMATLEEVDRAVSVLKKAGVFELVLLHCVSCYPCPEEECNLAVIDLLRKRYGCRVGWSDHSRSPAVMYRAALSHASDVVEFHLDLDGKGEEFSSGHCWLPDEIGPVVSTVKEGYAAEGNAQKEPSPGEMDDRNWRADPDDGLRPMKKLRES